MSVEKQGKEVMTLPWGFRGMVFNAVVQAEIRLGRPVDRNEVHLELGRHYYFKLHVMLCGNILQELFRNDDILADAEVTAFSARPEMQDSPTNPTGFDLFSDRVKRMFPSYVLGDNLRLVPGPDTPVVNFAALKEVLLSKDPQRNQELEWSKKELRFLDQKGDMLGNRVCFASFPRTGNTMTRNYVEAVTGIFTGSDMSLIVTNGLQMMGMAGEDHNCDDGSVWVTKSHWPTPSPGNSAEAEFTMDKVFMITRNPLDAIASMFLFINTGSHSK